MEIQTLHSPVTPSVGRIVLFRSGGTSLLGNYAVEVPAIVTRVWSQDCVNLMVMRDGPSVTPIGVTSVLHNEDANSVGGSYWRWPPRVPS